MADAGDSKSPARKGVPVQVRGSVVGTTPKTAQICAPFIRGVECYKSSGISGIYPESYGLPLAEKIVDTVKRTGTTNAEQTTPPVSAASVVADGLTCIGESALQTAQHLRAHPDEGKKVVETMAKINRQMTDLTRCAEQASDNSERLRGVVEEAQEVADWFKGQFTVPSGCGCCYNGNDSFAELLQR